MCGLRTCKHSEKRESKCRKERTEKTSHSTGLEKFRGDGLTLRMESNERDIEVTGDGCRLTVAENRGKIRINGDGCRVRIDRNAGDIEYRGDGGRVSLGPDSTDTKVHYFGEGGRVNIARAKNSSASGSTRKNDPSSTDRDDLAARARLVDDDDSADKRPSARRVLRTTSKTVRIIYGNPKIVSPPARNRNSIEISKSCTVSG